MGSTNKAALITGVNGQDGSYLAELLLEKGYQVTGVIRRTSCFNLQKLDGVIDHPRFNLVYGDLSDGSSMLRVVSGFYDQNREADRHEIYNLAAQSHVKVSFEQPVYTLNVDASGPLHILEAIIAIGNPKTFRFYQASTSEMFGKVQTVPQSETTPFYPRSPYGCGKLAAYWLTVNYRESYGIFACNGILFNHESPRRGETFVTRKITLDAAAIAAGKKDVCVLGNLDALRDWGHARDFVEGMWRMLQADEPEDFVLATGKQISIRSFAEYVFLRGLGIRLVWTKDSETGLETGSDEATGKVFVRTDPAFCRPAEVETLLGDSTKAQRVLGWAPSTSVHELADEMIVADFADHGVSPVFKS